MPKVATARILSHELAWCAILGMEEREFDCPTILKGMTLILEVPLAKAKPDPNLIVTVQEATLKDSPWEHQTGDSLSRKVSCTLCWMLIQRKEPAKAGAAKTLGKKVSCTLC